MKAISVPIAMLITLLLLISILIPAFIIFSENPIYTSQGQFQSSLYVQAQNYQNNQVYRGNPNIYYNSSSKPNLQFYFNSLPTPFNISQIYYFNGSLWVPILKNNIVISGNSKLPLPPKVQNKPIIILTSLANIYFLNPNTSVTTVTLSGPAGKVPIYITSYVINSSKIIPISLLVTFGSNPPALTPAIYYVNPGTYTISNKNSSIIFLKGYGLTAKFLDWELVGQGTINSKSPQSLIFTAYGPTVITILYNASLTKYSVTIVPSGIPLGQSIKQGGSVTLTALNKTIPVTIDNKTYQIPSSGITLNLTYGYHIVKFPTQYNITFNYTYNNTVIQAGEIITYSFSKLTTANSKNITVISNNTIFVNGTGTVYGNYIINSTYYLVTVKNDFTLPSGYGLVSNTSPVLGNLAGQLIQINNTYVWGPTTNYVPQKFYVKANSIFTITSNYSTYLPNGSYTLLYNKNNNHKQITFVFVSLLSYPDNVTIIYANGTPKPLHVGSSFTVSSPITVINYETWKYGATAG
ncbi:hypothetical protein [Metallosphaera sp.]|uniref:hypothetical protein n=1 Tax=Metallosphaera sp. TaxID=2020860 RepID=UPI003862099E